MRTKQVAYAVQFVLFAIAYFIVGRISGDLFGNPALVWPASGLAVAVLLLLGAALWPAIVAGHLVLVLAQGWPVIAGIGAAAGSAIEAFAAVHLLRLIHFRHSLDRLRDVLGFLAAALVGPLLGSLVTVLAGSAAGAYPGGDFLANWTIHWLAGSLSILIVAPALLTWATPGNPLRLAEATALSGILVAFGWAGGALAGWFGVESPTILSAPGAFGLRLPSLTPALLALGLILWAWTAIRFGPRGSSMATLLALSVFLGVSGPDLFRGQRETAVAGLLAVQIFLGVLGLISLGVAAAVAERTHAEAEVRRLASIVEYSTDAIIGQNLDGTVTSWNHGAEEMFGYTAAEVIGKPITLLLPPDRASVLAQVLERIQRGERVEQYETLRRHKDGQQLAISLTTSTIKDAAGTIVGAATIARDITDRKRAEEKLRASEERYRLLFERNLAGVLLFTSEGRILDCNEAAARILGYASAEELVSRSTVDIFAVEAERVQFIERLRQARVLTNSELMLLRKDGVRTCVLANMTLLEGRFGQTLLYGTLIDITERKRAEEALRESEARYRTLVEHAPEAVVVYDADRGRFIEANDNAVQLFGVPRDDLLAQSVADRSPPAQPNGRSSAAAAEQHLADALGGGTPTYEWVHRRADGKDVPCEVRLVRLPAAGRRLVRGSITDITERQRLEEEVRQAHKLDAVGRLAGGVAHDFNNLLTAILGFNNLTIGALEPQHSGHGYLREIQKAADRAARLTGQLLAFSRRAMLQPMLLDLNAVVAQTEATLRRAIGEEVELVTSLSATQPTIKADPSQLVQMLLDLAVNARDAMPGGGRLTLATADIELDEQTAKSRSGLKPGPYVMLRVTDTGCGMDAETLAHLFEPFFTTKGVGKGTGMGLATIYGSVKQSGGDIDVTSSLGQGTTFRVFLPRSEEPVAMTPAQTGGLPRGTETVLVVEDEGAVRRLTCQILRQRGYTVLEAGRSADALTVAEKHAGRIDLLITDIVMPSMNGIELARELGQARPGIKVMFVSGYSEEMLGEYGELPEVVLLRKPFGPEELLRQTRNVLDHGK
jgi:two-component system, cell cycle sensor histidine kinase and response regulator CckA